jgi:hypothetical protein
MIGSLLIRGMLAGVVAGLLAFGVAKVFGEPQVDRAIAFEIRMDEAKAQGDKAVGQADTMSMPKGMSMSNSEAAEPELVSRTTQSGIGLLTGVLTYSAAFGGLFALVFGFVYGRVSTLGPRPTSAILAAASFVAIYLVPNFKYPANPPSVGLSETIGYRTVLFFIMIAISIVAMSVAVMVRQRLVARLGTWNATLLGGAAFFGIIAVAQFLLPSLDEVPEDFPAVVLWNFRVASIGIQVAMWTTLGLVFGAFAEGVLLGHSRVVKPSFR